MAHRKDRFCNTHSRTYFKNTIEERNQYRQTFKRKPLGPQIARLNHLLEQIGTNKLSEDMLLIGLRQGLLHLLLQPLPPLRIGNMHELGSNGAAVEAARLAPRSRPQERRRKWLRRQVLPQRIKRSLKISPAAEYLKRAFAFVADLR